MVKYIDILDIRNAVKKGQIEVFVSKNDIYISDCQSGECVKIGVVKEKQE